jgi:undecaprenyl diphosphate synthase
VIDVYRMGPFQSPYSAGGGGGGGSGGGGGHCCADTLHRKEHQEDVVHHNHHHRPMACSSRMRSYVVVVVVVVYLLHFQSITYSHGYSIVHSVLRRMDTTTTTTSLPYQIRSGPPHWLCRPDGRWRFRVDPSAPPTRAPNKLFMEEDHPHHSLSSPSFALSTTINNTINTSDSFNVTASSKPTTTTTTTTSSSPLQLPRHIALVCDGNTRWAQQHHVPTAEGHARGAQRTLQVIRYLQQQLQQQQQQQQLHQNRDAEFRQHTPLSPPAQPTTNPTPAATTAPTTTTTTIIPTTRNAVTHVTFYVFSTENWSRPHDEIQDIFRVVERTAQTWYDSLLLLSTQNRSTNSTSSSTSNNHTTHPDHSSNVNIVFQTIGDLQDVRIPASLRTVLYQLQERTSTMAAAAAATSSVSSCCCCSLTVCLAINYGGRQDIVRASQRLVLQMLQPRTEPTTEPTTRDVQPNTTISATNTTTTTTTASIESIPTATTTFTKEQIEEWITVTSLSSCLDTATLPDPDLLIRTSGESRLSNFMLWNVAYTELYFTTTLWPDWDTDQLQQAMDWYTQRQRRFGQRPSGS